LASSNAAPPTKSVKKTQDYAWRTNKKIDLGRKLKKSTMAGDGRVRWKDKRIRREK